MSVNIVDACSECGSTDVSKVERLRGQRGHFRPPYYCYGCGIRFSDPARIDTVTGETI